MILHVMHSSGATRCCTLLSVGGVVEVIEAMGDDIVVGVSLVDGRVTAVAAKPTERISSRSALSAALKTQS